MSNKLKWIIVAGARPNFMKIAPLMLEIKQYNNVKNTNQPEITPFLVHTGQHYDEKMSKIFFEELEIPKPDIDLGIGSASHAIQTAKIMIEFERVCMETRPDLVIVVGDVNSTLACSVVAVKLGIKVAHVEAGLRSFDRSMPEEINRIITDSISDYLLTSCEDADENLKREGISEKKIHFVGNLMVDTLLSHRDKSDKSEILEKLSLSMNGHVNNYAVVTLHRPSNVDDKETFSRIIESLKHIAQSIPIIFPAHLRTQKQIESFKMMDYFDCSPHLNQTDKIHMIEPLGYLDFLKLTSNATLVLSDSGGIQEETTILGVPCLTIRENTERPVTITEGTNTLVGTDAQKIINTTADILNGKCKVGRVPALWDGKAARRVINTLINHVV